MPKRHTKIPRPTWEHEQTGITRKLEANRWQLWATAAIILLVVASLGVIGWAFLADYIDDQQRPGSLGLRVADRELTVEDYTNRAALKVEQVGTASAILIIPLLNQDLVEEMMLLQFADEQSVSATDDEISEDIATTLGISVDDANFDARLQEELTRNGLTEEQYRDISRAAVLKTKITAQFQAEVPKALPSVNYREIEVEDQETADGLVAQLNEGAEFGLLATESSINQTSAENGGEKGWVAEGVLNDSTEAVLFALEPGEITTFSGPNSVFVYEVTEKSDAHEVSESDNISLGGQAYRDWLADKLENIDIENEMDTQTGDAEKIGYVVDHANLASN
ncbi:MAG: peptidylprolyl isomerase [Chloroflexi bacterium]|nr:peptidylprolyl isomerase [Chloroflexota bacterium]